nr:hypothetical protein [Tanacetum cinerariifolium]
IIVSRNVLTFRIPSPFVIVIVVMFAVVGSLSSPACTTLSNSFPTFSGVFPLPEEVPTARRKFPLPEEVPTGSAK